MRECLRHTRRCRRDHRRRLPAAPAVLRSLAPAPGYDFTDPDVLLQGIPVTEFAELRKTAPVWWNEQQESIFDDGGYWVISRHEDIKSISRNGDLWSTNRKGAVMRLPDGVTSEQLDLTKALLINHDAPEHTRLRKIVSRLFTPRAVAALEEKLAVAARDIVAAAAAKDSGNFVDDVATKLPLLAIADLIGVPEADREKLFHWTNCIMNTDDPDFDSDPTVANAELMGYAYNMAEERRRCPADDIVTRLDPGRHRRRGDGRRRVRLLRHPARRGGQRDHPQRDDPRHERLLRQPRPVGALQAASGPRPRSTRSSAGPPRCTASSAPR